MSSYYDNDDNDDDDDAGTQEGQAEEDDGERFRRLLENIETAPDIDRKTSALQLLADYLPTFHSIPEPDHLTVTLKTLARDPHPTLSHAALDFMLPFLSHLRGSIHQSGGVLHLKTAVLSLMPSVLERNGDGKEKVRESALKALEELGKAAIDATRAALSHSVHHKSSETPLNLFERMLCDDGLVAKSAKIKEQACKVLPFLRAYYTKLPIKAFLSPLVELLSDADPHCREAARTTIVVLFSQASPTAKTDLKYELGAQNIRKALVDVIVREICGHEDGEITQESSKAFVAPLASNAPRTISPPLQSQSSATAASPMPAATAASDDNISPVHIFSRPDLERAFAAMLPHFEGKETEHNWLQRENSIIKVRGMLKAGGYEKYDTALVAGIKSLTDGILKAVGSLRTTLAMQGVTVITELAQRVGDDLADATIDTFLPALLKMAGYTKRIVANAAQDAVKALLRNVSYRHRILDLLWTCMQDKNITTRISMAEHLHTFLATHAEHRRHALESHDGLATIDKLFRKSLADQNKDVRANAREAYYLYRQHWPARGQALEGTLEPSIRKQIAACAPLGKVIGDSMKVATQGRSVSTAAPSASTTSDTLASVSKVAGGVVPGSNRRIGGPSNAILAAKARMVAEKKEQEARQYRNSRDTGLDEAEPSWSPSNSADGTPKRSSPSQARQSSTSQILRPAEIPLPSSPPASTFLLDSAGPSRNALSPSGSVASRSRAPSATSPHSSISRIPKTSEHRMSSMAFNGNSQGAAASVSEVGPASNSLDQIEQRFKPFQPTRARNVSSSTSGSSGGAGASSSSAAARARIGPGQLQPLPGADGGVQGTMTTSAAAKQNFSGQGAPSGRNNVVMPSRVVDPDDTVQLGKYDGDTTLDGDATLDLMGMSSSPLRQALRGADGVEGVDDSLSSAFSGLGRAARRQKEMGYIADEDQAAGDETNQSTPKVARTMRNVGQVEAAPSQGQPLLPYVGTVSSTPEVRASSFISTSPSEGKSYLASRASRLTSQAPSGSSSMTPLQSSPQALQWIDDVRLGKADVKTLTLLAEMSRSHSLRARHDTELNQGSEAATESHRQQKAEAWRELDLFRNLWEALERLLLSIFACSSDATGVVASTSFQPSETAIAAVSLLYKLVENQHPLFMSYALETDLLSLIFKIRGSASNHSGASGSRNGLGGARGQVLTSIPSASDALIDSWAEQTLPALGLSSLLNSMGSLAPSSSSSNEMTSDHDASSAASPSTSAVANDSRILVLSLRALSHLLLRLPPEMVLEELLRAKGWILRALNDEKVTTLRMAAVEVLSCAQVRIEQCGSEEENTILGPGRQGLATEDGGGNGGVSDPSGSGSGSGVEDLFDVIGPLKQAQKDLLMYYIGVKRKRLFREAQQRILEGTTGGATRR